MFKEKGLENVYYYTTRLLLTQTNKYTIIVKIKTIKWEKWVYDLG